MNLKYLLIVVAFLSSLSCENNTKPNQEEKHFDPKELSNLSLDSINGFWDNDSISSFSNYFDKCSEYIGGIGLKDNGKSIGLAVFETKEKAIISMEGRINSVPSVIIPGEPNELFTGKWWYSDGMRSYVFANQWNTIIEISLISEYDSVKSLLIETVAEISDRIDA